MKTRIISIYLLMPMLMACQNKRENLDVKKDSSVKQNQAISNDKSMEKLLIEQLKRGNSKYFIQAGVEIPQEEFTIMDINATAQISKNILSSNGYIFISQEKFGSKIKEIFDRTIDFNSDKVYLYINNFDRCDRRFNYYPNNGIDYNGMYIVKKEGFITDFYFIPELINYQKEFPKSIDIENNINTKIINKSGEEIATTLWKDIENNKDIAYSLDKKRKKNIQTIVARNMYLFNDSKAHGLWLRTHDEYFMKSLVTTFGYTKDKLLLQWVIEKNRFKNESRITNGEEYEKILWHKTCDGKLIFHKEVMEVMAKEFDKDSPNYVDDLFNYINYLDNEKPSTPLTFKEKAIVLANIFNITLEIDKVDLNNNFLYKVGGYYEYSGADGKKLDQEFKLNNYYGLPNFKTRWEEAKKEGDGINVPE